MSVTKCSMHAVLKISSRRPPTASAHSIQRIQCVKHASPKRREKTYILVDGETLTSGYDKKNVFKWSQLPLQLRINHECVCLCVCSMLCICINCVRMCMRMTQSTERKIYEAKSCRQCEQQSFNYIILSCHAPRLSIISEIQHSFVRCRIKT